MVLAVSWWLPAPGQAAAQLLVQSSGYLDCILRRVQETFPTLDYREVSVVLSDTPPFIFWDKKDKPSPLSGTSQSHFWTMDIQFNPQVDSRHNWAFTCREKILGDIVAAEI